MAAAVADYRPAQVAQDKIKKHDGELSIELERTDDILGWVGEHKPEQIVTALDTLQEIAAELGIKLPE